MITNDLIKNLFEVQHADICSLFLYKDHQLMKENRFQELIDRQLVKSRKIFYVGLSVVLGKLLLGLSYSWLYSESSDILHLIFSFFWLLMSVGFLYGACRQYFIISTSMSMLQKMLAIQKAESV